MPSLVRVIFCVKLFFYILIFGNIENYSYITLLTKLLKMVQKTKTIECSKCGEKKSTSQFNKETKSKTGYQSYCISCKKEIHGEYMKNNKSSLIYRIVNPVGDTYIGSTQRLLHLRFTTHRADYNRHLRYETEKFPRLYKSFDKWGIDAHTFELVADLGNISSEELRVIESKMIIALKKNGKSLNVNN